MSRGTTSILQCYVRKRKSMEMPINTFVFLVVLLVLLVIMLLLMWFRGNDFAGFIVNIVK